MYGKKRRFCSRHLWPAVCDDLCVFRHYLPWVVCDPVARWFHWQLATVLSVWKQLSITHHVLWTNIKMTNEKVLRVSFALHLRHYLFHASSWSRPLQLKCCVDVAIILCSLWCSCKWQELDLRIQHFTQQGVYGHEMRVRVEFNMVGFCFPISSKARLGNLILDGPRLQSQTILDKV